MKVMIDPPFGWRYGFPKELPEEVKDVKSWLIEQGYPEKEADFAVQYCRFWEQED